MWPAEPIPEVADSFSQESMEGRKEVLPTVLVRMMRNRVSFGFQLFKQFILFQESCYSEEPQFRYWIVDLEEAVDLMEGFVKRARQKTLLQAFSKLSLGLSPRKLVYHKKENVEKITKSVMNFLLKQQTSVQKQVFLEMLSMLRNSRNKELIQTSDPSAKDFSAFLDVHYKKIQQATCSIEMSEPSVIFPNNEENLASRSSYARQQYQSMAVTPDKTRHMAQQSTAHRNMSRSRQTEHLSRQKESSQRVYIVSNSSRKRQGKEPTHYLRVPLQSSRVEVIEIQRPRRKSVHREFNLREKLVECQNCKYCRKSKDCQTTPLRLQGAFF